MRRPIQAPFFEIGPKTYLYGEQAVELALVADRYAEAFGVDVIFTAQYTDLRTIRAATKNIRVYAQHMDPIYPGRGIGAVLPEAIREAGADGVMLNHAERPLEFSVLTKTIERAKEVGLETIVCAADEEEALRIARLGPTVLLVESPLLIGTGKRTSEQIAEVARINALIHRRMPDMHILHGAGISDEEDVYAIISAGAEATGSTSGIMKAKDPADMTRRMLLAVRRAWDENREEKNK